MNKRIAISILFLLIAHFTTLRAQQVSPEMALNSARTFCHSPIGTSTRSTISPSALQLVYTGGNEQSPDYYIYNVGDNRGFVIIAGDYRMKSVLAYTLEGKFDVSTVPDEFKELLKGYSDEAVLLRNIPMRRSNPAHKALLPITPLDEITRMTPLLDIEGIKYDQQNPYNLYCPLIQGQHVLTGCGATAMVQAMRYFKYPEHGQGSHKNISFANDSLIDFSKATYNWNQMLPTYTSQNPGTEAQRGAIALLMHHVGISIDMVYTLTGSGTGIRSVARSLTNFFTYNKNLDLAYRETYTNREWFELIKNELDNNRPVIYEGINPNSGDGHLFVCDGYDSEGRLHYNYGWSGLYNTYAFPTAGDDNSDATLCRYSSQNTVIIGINPEQTNVRPQIAQLSGINLSNLTPNTGAKFNASIRVSNYGYANFQNQIKMSLFQGEKEIVLQEQKVTVSTNNIAAGPDLMRTQNIIFKDLVIPAKTANGSYQLRCMVMGKDGKYDPILGQTGNVQRVADLAIANKKATFTYPLGEDGLQGPLTVTKKLEMSVNNGIGTARFTLNNPDKYNNTSKVYIIGFKNDAPDMEIFGTTTINVLPNAAQDIEIQGMRLNSGKYTYFVAFNPVDPEGSWWGAVPLSPANMSTCTLEVPAEKVDYSIDLQALTDLPGDFLQYKDGQIYTPTEPDDLNAPWRYYKNIQKAWSYFNASVPELGKSHLLATKALTVTDSNEVLEWSIATASSSSPAHYEVFVSTTGQDIKDLETAEKIHEADVENSSSIRGETVRISLFKYAGQQVYVFFKHTMTEDLSSVISLRTIRLLNIQSPRDIAVTGLSVPTREAIGETLPVQLTVTNRAPFPIKKFTASYTVGGQSYKEEITTDLAYDVPTTFVLKQATVHGNPGEKVPVSVTVSMEDEDPSLLDNNSASSSYTVMHFLPTRHMVVIKTSRGGCGACSSSYTTMDEIEEFYPASFTGGVELWQPYTGQPYYPEYGCSEFSNFYSGSTPAVYMNNQGVGFSAIDDIPSKTENKMNLSAPVSDVRVEAAYADADSRTLDIKISSRFALPLTGEYKLGAYIIESNVSAPKFQIFGGTPSGDKRTKNHMPVGTIGGSKGTNGFVVENPKEGEEYVYTCQYEVPETYGEGNETRPVDRENIQVIGLSFAPNGTIDNSAISSYYIRIPKTEGLTFVSEPGYGMFRELSEVAPAGNGKFGSVTKVRATVTAGNDFRFKILKAPSIAGKKLKVLVNKKANKGEEVELVRDADGAYTLEDVDRFYFLDVMILDEEEQPETRSFKITDEQGKELADGQEITVSEYTHIDEEPAMHLDFNITALKDFVLTLSRNDSEALPETRNSLCLGSQCTGEPEISLQLLKDRQATGDVTYYPGEAAGTSKLVYAFTSSVRGEEPLTITVNFNYDGKGTGIKPAVNKETAIFQLPGSGRLTILHTLPCRITISDMTGCPLQQYATEGSGQYRTDPLLPGCYVVTLRDKQGKTRTQKVLVH